MTSVLALGFMLVSFPLTTGVTDTGIEQDHIDEYRSLSDQYRRAIREVLELHKKGEDATDLFQAATRGDKIARFMELVRAYPGDPEAVDALVWVSKFSPWPPTLPHTSEADEAIRILARDYIRSERIGLALPGVMYTASGSEAAEFLYRKALEDNPHREVQGRACYWLARYLKEQADWVRELKRPDDARRDVTEARDAPLLVQRRWGKDALVRLKRKDAGKLIDEAGRLFERARTQYPEVMAYGYSEELGKIGEAALVELRAIRDLAVGKVAPEIEGEDIHGQGFKLSDYRGKVVVLTFSGNWCGPCRAMYPHEREIVARLKDKPFALLSVNTDERKETLRKSIESGEITWRCWSDGGTDGLITTAWGIESFPTVFILDPKGVIRFKDVRGDEMEKAVGALLNEGPGEKPSLK